MAEPLRDQFFRSGPGTLRFCTFDASEVSFWGALAKQNLYVRLVGRRWFVTDIEWTSDKQGFIAWIGLRSVLEAQK